MYDSRLVRRHADLTAQVHLSLAQIPVGPVDDGPVPTTPDGPRDVFLSIYFFPGSPQGSGETGDQAEIASALLPVNYLIDPTFS